MPGTAIRRILLGAAIAVLGAASAAQARPDTRTMTCAEAQALVDQYGAVVLTTGQHTYDRFVSGQHYCEIPNVAKMTWVQTRDTNKCPVAYTCKQSSDDEPFMRF